MINKRVKVSVALKGANANVTLVGGTGVSIGLVGSTDVSIGLVGGTGVSIRIMGITGVSIELGVYLVKKYVDLTSEATAADQSIITLTKGIADTAALSDTALLALRKTHTDSVFIDESVNVASSFNRNFTDSVGTSDAIVIRLLSNANTSVFNRVLFNSGTFG